MTTGTVVAEAGTANGERALKERNRLRELAASGAHESGIVQDVSPSRRACARSAAPSCERCVVARLKVRASPPLPFVHPRLDEQILRAQQRVADRADAAITLRDGPRSRELSARAYAPASSARRIAAALGTVWAWPVPDGERQPEGQPQTANRLPPPGLARCMCRERRFWRRACRASARDRPGPSTLAAKPASLSRTSRPNPASLANPASFRLSASKP